MMIKTTKEIGEDYNFSYRNHSEIAKKQWVGLEELKEKINNILIDIEISYAYNKTEYDDGYIDALNRISNLLTSPPRDSVSSSSGLDCPIKCDATVKVGDR